MWGYIVLVLALDVAPDVSFIEPIASEATCTAKAADWIHKAREWRQRSGLRSGTSVAICYPADSERVRFLAREAANSHLHS